MTKSRLLMAVAIAVGTFAAITVAQVPEPQKCSVPKSWGRLVAVFSRPQNPPRNATQGEMDVYVFEDEQGTVRRLPIGVFCPSPPVPDRVITRD